MLLLLGVCVCVCYCVSFENTHMEHLENCHPLTGAAHAALTVVHGGVEAIVVSRQIEVYT